MIDKNPKNNALSHTKQIIFSQRKQAETIVSGNIIGDGIYDSFDTRLDFTTVKIVLYNADTDAKIKLYRISFTHCMRHHGIY